MATYQLCDVIKNCLSYSRQLKHRKCEYVFELRKMLRLSSVTYSCQTICKTRDSFINWTVENCPISSPVRLLIQKLLWASDEGFKIASCVAAQNSRMKIVMWP